MRCFHRFLIALTLSVLASTALAQNAASDLAAKYRLGNGDKISILVFDEPDLTMEAIVSEAGTINFSYVGTIQVAGRTPTEIEERLTEVLRDGYLVNPSVNVTVSQYRPFYINGEVSRPGGYPYQPGLTVDKAIALAGGLTDRASRRKIYLASSGEGAGIQRERVQLDALVEPGDIITIDEGFF